MTNWIPRAAALVLAMTLAPAAWALKERSEEGFPLTFANTHIELGDQLEIGQEHELFFEVTNPTETAVTYFLKSSSRNAKVTHKHIEIEPGETKRIEVSVKHRLAGPFRYRIGVIVEPSRGAVFIEGGVVE